MPRIAPRAPRHALGTLTTFGANVPLAISSLAALILAAHGQPLGAPCLERTHHYRRRSRRPNEQKLLKHKPVNRPKHAEDCGQKRNWKQGRHARPTFATRAVDNARLEERNAGRLGSVPAESAGIENIFWNPSVDCRNGCWVNWFGRSGARRPFQERRIPQTQPLTTRSIARRESKACRNAFPRRGPR